MHQLTLFAMYFHNYCPDSDRQTIADTHRHRDIRMVYNQQSTTHVITDNTQAEMGASLYLGTLLQSKFDRTDSLTDTQTNIYIHKRNISTIFDLLTVDNHCLLVK